MFEKYKKTLKSTETDDLLDLYLIRPICYYLAVFFNKFDIRPNTVTIWSMLFGIASAYFFAQGSYYYCGHEGIIANIIAFVLLMIADFLDCTDGQLARLSGKKSRLGRILDGIAGFTWFGPIYVCLVYRFYLHHDIEFNWLGIENNEQNTLIATAIVFVLGLVSGVKGMAGQQRLADYYIQAHLFFLKGESGSELDNFEQQKQLYKETSWEGNYVWKAFLLNYVGYTKKQEDATPEFQRLMRKLKEKFGSAGNAPQEVRKEFHEKSLRLMFWNGLLTFNFRTFWLILFCMLDVPVLNFVFETFIMFLLYLWIRHRHESFCKQIADRL